MTETQSDAPAIGGKRQSRAWVALPLVISLAAAGLLAYGSAATRPAWEAAALAVLGSLALAGLCAALAGHFAVTVSQRRAFFDAVLDGLNEPCVVADRRGRVVYANAAHRELTAGHGRTIGIEHFYAGYPDVAERIYRVAQAGREGRPASEEFRLNPGSGAPGARPDRPAWIKISVSPLAGAGRAFLLWRLTDMTVERERQEAAFTRLQYIVGYLDRAPAGFFSTTPEGDITYVNATLAEWLGIELASTENGSLKLADLLSPSGAQLIMSFVARPEGARTEIFDLDLKTAGGTMPVRIVHLADCEPDGTPLPSRSLVLDRRSDTIGSAEPSAEQFARLVNGAPIGMARVDQQGQVVNANGAFVALSEGKVRGAALAELIVETDRTAVRESLAKVLAGEAAELLKVTFAGPSQHTGELSFQRLEPAGAGTAGTFVYAIDTTKHASLEVQLVQSQKMQAVGQLAGGMAHDFNNVLTAIIGFSDLLLAKHRPTDPAFGDIMNIKQNANRAANLVRQLLAFSRRQTLRPEVLSLTDIFSDLGNLLGRLLGEKIELKIVHGRDLWPVKVDLNQFEQVIINLSVNARDAMPNGGTLTIRNINVPVEEDRKSVV